MTETERLQIITLVKNEVVPAIGCTEPIAVALCVAKAVEVLNKRPEKITVLLSANILKNAMGVGIPGTGMIGLPIVRRVAPDAFFSDSVYNSFNSGVRKPAAYDPRKLKPPTLYSKATLGVA